MQSLFEVRTTSKKESTFMSILLASNMNSVGRQHSRREEEKYDHNERGILSSAIVTFQPFALPLEQVDTSIALTQ